MKSAAAKLETFSAASQNSPVTTIMNHAS